MLQDWEKAETVQKIIRVLVERAGNMKPRSFSRFFAFLVIIFLVACSSKKDQTPTEISEQKSTSGVSLDSPEAVLFKKAQELYQNQLYSLAIEHFEALRTGYPLGPYGEYAEIKLADCRFEQSEYELAAQGYEDFIKSHPISRSIPYALFRAARSYQLANRGVGRDPVSLENSAKYYQRLLTEYPDSFYTLAAAENQKEVLEKLAEHEKKIISFYEKKNKLDAVGVRTSAYNSLVNPKLVTARKLAEDEKGKEEAKSETEANENKKEAHPGSEENSEQNSNPQLVPTLKIEAAIEEKARIREIRCETPSSYRQNVFVFLEGKIDGVLIEKMNANLKPVLGKLVIRIPELRMEPFSKDCFTSQDLSVTSEGEIQLKSDKSAKVLSLKHPDRILIILE
ncbi:MAG: outer membrane protein assembly factor BamD [SAR324 cluster bacterium]|uniref:Outer membrane protein assembly factor BamD n=1 Tax=SAR324 cluster bacterium TaxID=2024889 RepID=A0A7X9IL61_9DELT|nr:outer membrane protein assembly factor BamD [SAR324 cluster bacterium]